jgi:hypothetical protein
VRFKEFKTSFFFVRVIMTRIDEDYIKKKNLVKLSLKNDINNNNTDNKSWSDSFSLDTIGTTNMVAIVKMTKNKDLHS